MGKYELGSFNGSTKSRGPMEPKYGPMFKALMDSGEPELRYVCEGGENPKHIQIAMLTHIFKYKLPISTTRDGNIVIAYRKDMEAK